MQTAPAALLNVLRCELDATNQQFVHILALRLWGEKEAAKRITEVDDIDFPNAMRIIDYLVTTDTPIELAAGGFAPGTDYRSILISERAMESRLGEAIDDTERLDDRAQRLLEAASAPRAAYARWLDDRIAGAMHGGQKAASEDTATAGLSAHLITLIEQSMIHAFVHWHAGDPVAADAAWATSGAAMMHMTRLVQLFAMLPGTPVPGACPVPRIQNDAADTLDADRELARLCAQQALAAAGRCEHEAIARLCTDITDYYQSLSAWQPQTPHPAADTNPPAFHSFEATLSRFVS
jgi:bacterioferritin (cytochrome b1)